MRFCGLLNIILLCMLLLVQNPCVVALEHSDDFYETGVFREQLSENSKNCYDAIKNMFKKNQLAIDNKSYVNVVVDGDFDEQNDYQLVMHQVECDNENVLTLKGETLVKNELNRIFDAFVYDHPQYYWIEKLYGCDDSLSVSDVKSIDGKNFAAVSMKVKAKAKYWNGVTPDRRENFVKASDRYYRKCVFGKKTTYDKVKSFHDSLCKDIEYRDDYSSEYVQTAADVFLQDYGGDPDISEGVCEAYAKAMKILCDKAKISCVIVVGHAKSGESFGNHAWNAVKMDDGKWYAIDLTWDDVEENCTYDFFLCGNETIFENSKFSDSHMAGKLELVKGGFLELNFYYPKLCDFKYDAEIK